MKLGGSCEDDLQNNKIRLSDSYDKIYPMSKEMEEHHDQ